MKSINYIFILLLNFYFLISCESKKVDLKINDENPVVAKAHNVFTVYSEDTFNKIKLKAKLQQEYQNKDRSFPKGVFLTFFKIQYGESPAGDVVADYAYYYASDKFWHLKGNVVLRDIIKSEVLTTEELFWKPETKKIWTEKFVYITAPERELMGDGLDALEDLSWYRILQPRGRKMNIE